METMKKIVHITTVHPRYDTRIFHKECISLSKQNDVSLIVADGLGSEIINSVSIIDIGIRQSSRVKRAFIDSRKALKTALALNADIYHFHDPELIMVGIKLKKKKKKVIYDIHEDVSTQIMQKEWIPIPLQRFISFSFKKLEDFSCRKFDYLLVPQNTMKKKFSLINRRCALIANYPIIPHILESVNAKKKKLIYVGSLTESRGLFNMLDLICDLGSDYRLTLIGKFSDQNTFLKAEKHIGWKKVDYLGYLNYQDIGNYYLEHSVGLILFNKVGQYHMANAVKSFEYMMYGLTIMIPDFGEWIKFNKNAKCGYNVNTTDSKLIARIISELSTTTLNSFSAHNRHYVKDNYNWASEEMKLLNIYNELETQI